MTLALAIKTDPAISGTRLLMLTSLGQREECETLRRAGISRCLSKPVKQAQLFDSIEVIMADEIELPHLSKPVKTQELAEMLERWGAPAVQAPPPAPADTPPKAAGIDLTVLDSFRELQEEGQPDFVGELIDLYLNDTQARLAALRAALRRQDTQALRGLFHALKGSSGNLGVLGMAALCSELEKQCEEGELVEGGVMLAPLEAEFARVAEAFADRRGMVTQ